MKIFLIKIDIDKSCKEIQEMIKLIAQIQVNLQWLKKSRDEKMREKSYKEIIEESDILAKLIVDLLYIKSIKD